MRGHEPASRINDNVVAVMLEEGIDLSRGVPRLLTSEEIALANRVVAMGCDIGNLPRVDEDWSIEDVNALSLDELRTVRDHIKRLVFGLAGALNRRELGVRGEVAVI